MKITQTNLKNCVESSTFKSLGKLSNALQPTDDNDDTSTSDMMTSENDLKSTLNAKAVADRLEQNNDATAAVTEARGENKVIVKRRFKNKLQHSYKMKATVKKASDSSGTSNPETPRRRPKYFCKF